MLLDFLIFGIGVCAVLYLARRGMDALGMEPDQPAGRIALIVMMVLMPSALGIGFLLFANRNDEANGLLGLASAGVGIVVYLVTRLIHYGDNDG